MKIEEVEDLEVDGVDSRDYPDFCDAYIMRGIYIAENRELTEEECQYLTETYPEKVNEMAYESLIP